MEPLLNPEHLVHCLKNICTVIPINVLCLFDSNLTALNSIQEWLKICPVYWICRFNAENNNNKQIAKFVNKLVKFNLRYPLYDIYLKSVGWQIQGRIIAITMPKSSTGTMKYCILHTQNPIF